MVLFQTHIPFLKVKEMGLNLLVEYQVLLQCCVNLTPQPSRWQCCAAGESGTTSPTLGDVLHDHFQDFQTRTLAKPERSHL